MTGHVGSKPGRSQPDNTGGQTRPIRPARSRQIFASWFSLKTIIFDRTNGEICFYIFLIKLFTLKSTTNYFFARQKFAYVVIAKHSIAIAGKAGEDGGVCLLKFSLI